MHPRPAAALDDPAAAPSLGRRLLALLLLSPRLLALADQALVSGTSFATTVAIGRFTFPSELGVYALGMSLLIAAVNLQHALISLPHTLRRHQAEGGPAEHAGNSLVLSVALSASASAGVAVVGLAMHFAEADPRLAAVTLALAAAAPFLLLRELARDLGFARLDIAHVLVLDATVAAAQLGTLATLAWSGRMSAVAALAAIGAACGVAATVGLAFSRRQFAFCPARLARTARESWRVGKWLLANLLALVLQVQLAYWLVAALAGTAATGIYAACMSVAALVNPLVSGLSNSMLPRAALALAQGGPGRLWRESVYDALLLAAATGGFCLAVMVAGEPVMHLLYGGGDYAGHVDIVFTLAAWQFVQAVGIPPSNALAALERARANFWLGLGGNLTSAAAALLLIGPYGPLGAAAGLLVGTAICTALRWGAIVHLHVRPEAPQ